MPLKKRPFRGPRTLTAKVNSLSKAVNANKNERQYFIKETALSTPAGVTGFHVNTISCIQDQLADSNFPFTISGDKWNLHSLRLQGVSARTVVYIPKRSGQRFTPLSFNEIPDPKQWTILMDSTFQQYAENSGTAYDFKRAIDLNINRGVLINRNGAGAGSVIERGDLVICHINKQPFGALTNPQSVSYKLTFSDK